MTEITQAALDRAEDLWKAEPVEDRNPILCAFARYIMAVDAMARKVRSAHSSLDWGEVQRVIKSFILPDPADPLDEILGGMGYGPLARVELYAELAKRGLAVGPIKGDG